MLLLHSGHVNLYLTKVKLDWWGSVVTHFEL